MNRFNLPESNGHNSPSQPLMRKPKPESQALAKPGSKSAGALLPMFGNLTPRDYFLMIRERWYWGLLAGLLAAAGIIYLEGSKPEMYRTEAALLFEPRPDRVLNIEQVVDTDGAGQLNNHIEQLRSASFFNFVESSLTEEERGRIIEPYRETANGRTPSLGAIIRPNLTVQIRRNTSVVTVGASHRDPQAAALIADRFARNYIEFNLDRSQTGTQSAIVFLQDQAADLRREVEEAERDLQRYRADHNVASLQDNQNVIQQRVNSMGGAVISAQVDRLNVETRLNKVDEFRENGRDLTEIGYIQQYGSIPALLRELDDLQKEQDQLNERYLENHPRMQRNAQRIESVKRVIDSNIESAISELRSQYEVAQARERDLNRELEEAEQASLELDSIAVNYRIIERQAETARRSYDRVLDRLNETTIASQLDNTNIRVLDTAWTPGTPSEPNMTKAIIQGGLVMSVLFFGLPIGIGLIDSRLKASWDVEEELGVTLLGEVPKLKGVKTKDRPTLVLEGKQEEECESFRGLFSSLELHSYINYPKTILITSTVPREGKSVISNNLAATIASHGKRVLIVDADFRRPSLHDYNTPINQSKSKGKPSRDAKGYLPWIDSGEDVPEDPRQCAQLGIRELGENLDLLPAGRADKRPTVHFQKDRFTNLFKAFKHHYDVVIVDSPPVGVFPDALMLSRLCEETIYVCRFNKVPKGRIQACLDRLSQSETTLAGVVLNGLPHSRASTYSYYGYGYGENRKYAKEYAAA